MTEFWELNFAQFEHCVDGYYKRIGDQAKLQDRLNHIFGQYLIPAIHRPKQYPKQSNSEAQEQNEKLIFTTDDDRYMRAKLLYGK